MQNVNVRQIFMYSIAILATIAILPAMLSPLLSLPLLAGLRMATAESSEVDLSWYPPKNNSVSSLASAINGTGIYGFIFNSSQTPSSLPYFTYNWCNMPHVRPQEYVKPSSKYSLKYVELIHRHHKRTPYAANTFPVEGYPWDCHDSGLFYYGEPLNPAGNSSAPTYWTVFEDAANPYNGQVGRFAGNCEFPQITREGLNDAWQHGKDLYAVYQEKLGLITNSNDGKAPRGVSFRVSNNVITSQVAGMVINGMFGIINAPTPLLVQPPTIDSLEPTYSCPAASSLKNQYGSGSTNPTWQRHLRDSANLASELDRISGVSPSAPDWHVTWDHYFDNLSARLCHSKPLPCNVTNPSLCIHQDQVNEVFRLGEWEYNWLYRGASNSLAASTASYGVWVGELASHLRAVSKGDHSMVYRHNVGHDGSVSPLLSILQIDEMVWPGMGAEVLFELYEKADGGGWFVRVLWGGQVVRSSSPTLGKMDMVPLERVLAYFDGLVGLHANLIPGKCSAA
ncbi:hypothetical protein MMC07_000064 [Pseudocyphellaria aurata]|nr:hypothetical protein [Pseudocyphellaria aurata]